MRKCVYIETTIPSYLAAWLSRDIVQAARQQITRHWWEHERHLYDLCVSRVVFDEAASGDPDAAERRLALITGLSQLDLTPAVDRLAIKIIESELLPPRAVRDAIHIAVSSVHAVDMLLTWNCRHIANAVIMRELGQIVSDAGYQLPIICTPEELTGD